MVSAASTCESCLIWIATSAPSIAAATATSTPALKLCDHGRTITSTPTNPASTASQRRRRTVSPSSSTAPMVTNTGEEYDSATACASGRLASAQKPQNMLTRPMAQRSA